MQIVGTIDLSKFKSIFNDITTNEVVLTSDRLAHIITDHPGDYEKYSEYVPDILENPDYIIEANRPNSAVLLKDLTDIGVKIQIVLRINTSSDPAEYKNSIITLMKIRTKEWRRLLKSKIILYKST